MKKDIKKDVPQAPEQPVSNVRAFFTKEINDQIVGMNVKEMESILKELIGTREFIAILKYSSMRTPLLDASLRATNPIKDPHTISWSQGAMAGVTDLESYIIDLNAPKQESEEEDSSDARPEGVIMG